MQEVSGVTRSFKSCGRYNARYENFINFLHTSKNIMDQSSCVNPFHA